MYPRFVSNDPRVVEADVVKIDPIHCIFIVGYSNYITLFFISINIYQDYSVSSGLLSGFVKFARNLSRYTSIKRAHPSRQ